jgi:carboxyl-terminal processing protease|tara:strand:+ start:516 stop:1943 length:1428 start_codon:yes stop_codon:yes gene_type:complete
MKRILPILLLLFITISCSKEDDNVPDDIEIQNFIWKGLNAYYFWQQDIPDLSDQKFSSQEQLNSFLEDNSEPEEFFYSMLNNYPTTDKYSWIVDDYIALEQLLQQGISGVTGAEFGLVFETGSETDIYGYIRYIIPGSDAATKNIQRGDVFYAVDGTELTINNYRDLLFSASSYTLNLADYNGGNPTSNGQSVSLTKTEVQENPVFITKTFDVMGKKIGYLMYNGFTSAFNNELNNAFASLSSEGVTDLVLDFRYNPGGSVRTATYLSSMVTGQFTGELFTKEKWNDKWQNYFDSSSPESLINNFVNQTSDGSAINSLNLNDVVILTTGGSASASELVINGLNPYINVTTIGTKTEGKYVASVTLYDSDDYRREGANPNHTWAMQPIVLEEQNKLGENDEDGFDPTIEFPENRANLGILGEVTEPLLERAITFITTGSRASSNRNEIKDREFTHSKKYTLTGTNMYVDKELFVID